MTYFNAETPGFSFGAICELTFFSSRAPHIQPNARHTPQKQAGTWFRPLPPQFALFPLLIPILLRLNRRLIVAETQVPELVLRHEVPL
jgi:hypothetical protein